ncbi:MAG TPA: hypothetical protein VF384_12995 [Planctomycetota bacterium]
MFAVIEQKEPHAGRMAFADVAQPVTFAERCALARRIRDELEVTLPIWIDGMDDASRALFSDLPSPAFLIDRSGLVAEKLPWADPAPLETALDAVLAREGALPARKAAAVTLDQRDAVARRLLALDKPAEALALLDAGSEVPHAPATCDAFARAAITRASALCSAKAGEPQRTQALVAARAALAAAWPHDSARRTAARIELAEAAAGTPAAEPAWREALAGLDAGTPALTRDWLTQRAAAKGR